MCGIAGIFSLQPIEGNEIYGMTTKLSHRGPDASNVCFSTERRIALGHTRLSIIDLSKAANQPFFSDDGKYAIVFNGEVYNFKLLRKELESDFNIVFNTHSDTEVILKAFNIWGAKMVDKLHGMFSIAIADFQKENLFLFRDRLGKKPLYYFHSSSIFVFGSEIKSLLEHQQIRASLSINRKVISTFLHLGNIPEPDTIYTLIKKFPSGCIGELDANLHLSIKPYWSLENFMSTNQQLENSADIKHRFHSILDQAVQRRLISDVPLGAFLSGGTDSSLITALASGHVSTPLKTFSIGFKETKFDESIYARQVAAHLKTDHTEYILEEREAIDLVDIYLKHFDEPFADTSAIPTMLVSKLARKDVKVVLTGDGGDELFQGYGAYAWADRLESNFWKAFKKPIRFGMRLSGDSRLQRISHLLDPVTDGNLPSHIFSQEQYFFSQQEIRNELLRSQTDFFPFEFDNSFIRNKKLSGGEGQAIFDIRYYLKDDLLVKVDRASMFYSLECRCPLLDHNVVEFALSLPKTFKTKGGVSKWLLKEILREYIPDSLVDRPKWGFSVPLANWLRGGLSHWIDKFLNESVVEEIGLFNPGYIQELKKDFFKGKDYLYNRIWVIIVLHKWLKENHL